MVNLSKNVSNFCKFFFILKIVGRRQANFGFSTLHLKIPTLICKIMETAEGRIPDRRLCSVALF